MPKTVALFAREDDLIAARMEELLVARGAIPLRVAFGRMAAGAPALFDGERFVVEGRDLCDVDAYLLRHYPSESALLSADPSSTLSAAEWWQRGVQQKERSHFAQSALMALDLANKRAVNAHLKSAPFDLKPLQLLAFTKAGLPIPKTLITNDPDEARAFHRDVGEVIAKPAAGGAETRVLDEALLSRLDAIRSAPAIFQERVRGPDIRVTVVDGRVVSAVEIPTEEVDYRADAAYREGFQEYLRHPLSDDVVAMCVKAAEVCHHVLSGIDLKRRSDGSYAILEANSAPVYLDIERKTGAPISEAIADYLLT